MVGDLQELAIVAFREFLSGKKTRTWLVQVLNQHLVINHLGNDKMHATWHERQGRQSDQANALAELVGGQIDCSTTSV